jgi:hypothetical protein
MTKTLFEKLFLKSEYAIAFLHIPDELHSKLESTNKADTVLKTSYNFILAFYNKKADFEKEINTLKEALLENGLLWIAYPKAKALTTDLNRDILHEAAKQYGLDGVSLVSLNDTWSAMRFKK